MILKTKRILANRQLRLTITVERDAWEKALNDAYQECQGPVPCGGLRRGQGSP